jgi:hypothetical protein
MKTNTFFFVNQIDSIGNFQLTKLQPISKKMHPVFKTINIGTKINNYDLIPGYIDLNNEFYHCPLQVGFTTIISFEFRLIITSTSVERRVLANLNLSDKNYNKTENVQIVFSEFISIPFDFDYFVSKINFINNYIFDDQNFELLDFKKISTFYTRQFSLSEKISFITNQFENITILTYDNGKYRPGKDDYFWKEIEFHNLPKNKYILELLIDTLKSQNINAVIQNNILSFTLDDCFLDYRSAPARTQIFLTDQNINNSFNLLIATLKYQMIKNFCEKKYSFSINII